MSTMSDVRPMLWARCGGRCEITGALLDFETFDAHHRRNKGMGGTSRANRDNVENLLALTPAIHNGGPNSVHQNPSWSRPRGYLVRKHVEHPGMVPVLLLGRRWVLLGTDGRYHPLPPGVAPPVV